jgi:hypothetical protein
VDALQKLLEGVELGGIECWAPPTVVHIVEICRVRGRGWGRQAEAGAGRGHG